jgi:hypothetical protein
MSYLVYEYGCLPPLHGREAALEQMLRRHRLWNSLVEVESRYRLELESLLRDPVAEQDLAFARARLAELRQLIKSRRQAERKRTVEVSDLQVEIARAKLALTAAISAARKARRARVELNKGSIELLETARHEAVKQVQSDSGLYWCNYDDVIAAYETARKRALREGRQLRFQAWDGTGKVTVRYQQGLPVAELQGADRRLQIDPVNAMAWTSSQRSERRKLARTRVRIRVGSDGRTPVWLELPANLHRAMPADGTVRSASVLRDKVGGRERWRLLVTVAQPERAMRQGPAVALDLGWRVLPHGLRVASWEDERGDHGELFLEPSVLWQFAKINDLRSIQDQHLRAALAVLGPWWNANGMPGWMDLSHINEWRQPWRLLKLYAAWKDRRVPGDADAFDALAAWKERHHHLHDWETNLRDQVMRHRKEIYRRFVADLLRTHGRVFLEDLDLRSLARQESPEEDTYSYSGSMRVVASVSLLARLFHERGDCVRIAPNNTTQQCSWCGRLGEWDAAGNLILRCAACGTVFDQDRNAARNILHRGLLEPVAGSHELAASAAG